MKTILSRLAWAFALLVVLVMVLEFSAREKYSDLKNFPAHIDLRLPPELVITHEELGYHFKPNSSEFFESPLNEFNVNYQTNEFGLRDSGMFSSGPKQPIVVVLGGATAEAYGVMREASFTLEMQRRLRFQKGAKRYPRILSAGMTGFGAIQNYLLGKRLISELKPDLVIFLYSDLMPVADYRVLRHANLDHQRMVISISPQLPAPVLSTKGPHWSDQFTLLQIMRNHEQKTAMHESITIGDPNNDLFAAARDSGNNNVELHQESLKYVAALADYSNAQNVKFALVHLPLPHQIAADEWSEGRHWHKIEGRTYAVPEKTLTVSLCERADVECIEVFSKFKELAANHSGRVFFKYSYALSEIGHRALVDHLINPVRTLLGIEKP
ncbi:MAG: hypothetical protein AAF387_13225 [Pseudomonadota bacterium]